MSIKRRTDTKRLVKALMEIGKIQNERNKREESKESLQTIRLKEQELKRIFNF